MRAVTGAADSGANQRSDIAVSIEGHAYIKEHSDFAEIAGKCFRSGRKEQRSP
jgi:hypothetical protein